MPLPGSTPALEVVELEEAARVASAKAAEEAMERAAFLKIVRAIRGYAFDAADEVRRWEHNFARLPVEHQHLLRHHKQKHLDAYTCIERNANFFKELLRSFSGDEVPDHLRVPELDGGEDGENKNHRSVPPSDAEKVRYILKNLSRDWSAEASEERAQSHGPILAELEERLYVPKDAMKEGRYPPRVLVPGAGLGRLVLECAARGFETEGNEYSYYMLLTSSFVLNQCQTAGQFEIHPWIHSNNNHTSDSNQTRAVPIPDLPASDADMKPGNMSMCAGDFCEVYGAPEQKKQWDAIATCFFIDTAHNVVEYLQIIADCLKPGGIWVNFGPLLFHWADASSYLQGDEVRPHFPNPPDCLTIQH